MPTRYPSQVDTSLTLPTVIDNVTPIEASVINRLRDAILATQGALGPNPAGVYGNVRNRLDSLEKLVVAISPGASVFIGNTIFDGDLVADGYTQNVIGFYGRPLNSAAPNYESTYMWDGYQWAPNIAFQAGQDLSGTKSLQTVVGLRNRPLDTTTPQDGYAYLWDMASSKWVPKATFIASGDLIGNRTSQSVVGIYGRSVSNTAPFDNQALVWDNSIQQWTPKTISAGGTPIVFGGDLFGGNTSQTVVGLQSTAVSNTAPSSNNALVFDGYEWLPTQLTLDPELIGPAFAISLSGGTLVEVSNTVTNPSFTSSKNYTGTAAVLTNTDNVESKNVLTEFNANSAFTSNFSYVKNTYGSSVTFTLTANKGAIVRTSQTSFTWVQKVFWGVGAAGGNSEAFIEALGNNALATSKSRSFSITAGATEKVYYAYRSAFGTATFFVGGFEGGFSLVSTTISVTNAFGFTENYTLYESDNLNLGTITVTVV